MTSAPGIVVAGFDLGTCSSCVALSRDGVVEVMLNAHGKRDTQSTVTYGKQRIVGGVGSAGQNASVISEVKRIIGKEFRDPLVKKYSGRAGLLCKVCEGVDGRCAVRVPLMTHPLAPEQVMATLLKDLKTRTQTGEKDAVQGAVLSVPAFCGESERSAMLTAAELAGLSDVHLMNDLTAASLNWTVLKADELSRQSSAVRVAFLDVGHSSTQVCIADITTTEVRVVAHAWDSALGGLDLDEVLMVHFCKQFRAMHQRNMTKDPKSYLRMTKAVKKIRETLTVVADANFELEDVMGDIDFRMELTRKKFEELTAQAIKQIETPCQQALKKANENPKPIHSVEMVGEASRTPAIEKRAAEVFGQSVKRTMNSKECVSRGCAYWAAMQSHSSASSRVQVTDMCSAEIVCQISDKDRKPTSITVFSPQHHVPELRQLSQGCRVPLTSVPCILKFSSTSGSPGHHQQIAEIYVGGATQAPEDAVEKIASVLVRLDRNCLLRCITATMEYAQLQAPTSVGVFADGHQELHLQLSSDGVDGRRRKEWDHPSERANCPTHTVVRSKVSLAHTVKHLTDVPQTQLECWRQEEQQMLAADENQRLTDQARNDLEKLIIKIREKFKRQWACAMHLPTFERLQLGVDQAEKQLRGAAEHVGKEEFDIGKEVWQAHEKKLDELYVYEKYKLELAYTRLQDWCQQIEGSREPLLFGFFVDKGKRNQLLHICRSTREWLQLKRASWSTTAAELNAKWMELRKQKEQILTSRSHVVQPVSTAPDTALSGTKGTSAFSYPSAGGYSPRSGGIAQGSRAFSGAPLHQLSTPVSYADATMAPYAGVSMEPSHRTKPDSNGGYNTRGMTKRNA